MMEDRHGIPLFWQLPGGNEVIPYSEALAVSKERPLSKRLFPRGIELLQGLEGFEERIYMPLRDDILNSSNRDTFLLLLISRTGGGKRTAAAQVLFALDNDPVLTIHFNESKEGRILNKRYIAFAESATLLRYRGTIPFNEGHGRYSPRSYHTNSVEMVGFIAREFNHANGPTVIVTEHSAPSAIEYPDGTLVGSDRAYTTAKTIARNFGEKARVVAIKREVDLYEKILSVRRKVAQATPLTIADILEEGGISVYKGKAIEDIRSLPENERQELINELNLSWAPAEGVEKAQKEMDEKKKLLKDAGKIETEDEQELWQYILVEDMGFDPKRILIADNPLNPEGVSLHEDLLRRHDPLRPEILERKQLMEAHLIPGLSWQFRLAIEWRQMKHDFRLIRRNLLRNLNR
jgi:hypothetical protein